MDALNYLLPGIVLGMVVIGAAIGLEAAWTERKRAESVKPRAQEGEWE